MSILPHSALLFMWPSLAMGASVVIQEWNFTEDGAGLANDRNSEQGLNSQFFDSPDPVAFDGGLTVQRGPGFSGDRPLGINLDDSNTSIIEVSITMASFDFSAGNLESNFLVRLREDATNTNVGVLELRRQERADPDPDRMRIHGDGVVAGIATSTDVLASSFTYGVTFDLQADTYTYWIGSPSSGSETWDSRFANHTGSIAGLGTTAIDAIQWGINSHTTGDEFVLDQIQVSYTPIPESSIALLGGLGVLGLLRRRR